MSPRILLDGGAYPLVGAKDNITRTSKLKARVRGNEAGNTPQIHHF